MRRVLARLLRLGDVAAAVQVLGVQQRDELRVRAVVAEHEADQLHQGFERPGFIQRQRALGLVHLGVDALQHGDEQAFLAAEIVVDHAVHGLGRGRDLVHRGAVVAVAREHPHRRAQDRLPRGLRRRRPHARAPLRRLGRCAGGAHACSPCRLATPVSRAPDQPCMHRRENRSPGPPPPRPKAPVSTALHQVAPPNGRGAGHASNRRARACTEHWRCPLEGGGATARSAWSLGVVTSLRTPAPPHSRPAWWCCLRGSRAAPGSSSCRPAAWGCRTASPGLPRARAAAGRGRR